MSEGSISHKTTVADVHVVLQSGLQYNCWKVASELQSTALHFQLWSWWGACPNRVGFKYGCINTLSFEGFLEPPCNCLGRHWRVCFDIINNWRISPLNVFVLLTCNPSETTAHNFRFPGNLGKKKSFNGLPGLHCFARANGENTTPSGMFLALARFSLDRSMLTM